VTEFTECFSALSKKSVSDIKSRTEYLKLIVQLSPYAQQVIFEIHCCGKMHCYIVPARRIVPVEARKDISCRF